MAKYKQVQDLDIEWPSELKLTILDQALREKAAAQDVEGFFAACIPWAAPSQLGGNRGAEGNESVEGFSAMDPRLFSADGSPDEMAAHCAASVGTFFQKNGVGWRGEHDGHIGRGRAHRAILGEAPDAR